MQREPSGSRVREVCAQYGHDALATDDLMVVQNMLPNLTLNRPKKLKAVAANWYADAEIKAMLSWKKVDYILMSEVVYFPSLFQPLLDALTLILNAKHYNVPASEAEPQVSPAQVGASHVGGGSLPHGESTSTVSSSSTSSSKPSSSSSRKGSFSTSKSSKTTPRREPVIIWANSTRFPDYKPPLDEFIKLATSSKYNFEVEELYRVRQRDVDLHQNVSASRDHRSSMPSPVGSSEPPIKLNMVPEEYCVIHRMVRRKKTKT
ncbi:unnamed protein product [Amoebophrya sp. A25]|nr:unnamed protein product [Amoebophrya sp. A25]|eukprot:GSA25T00009426001.1